MPVWYLKLPCFVVSGFPFGIRSIDVVATAAMAIIFNPSGISFMRFLIRVWCVWSLYC